MARRPKKKKRRAEKFYCRPLYSPVPLIVAKTIFRIHLIDQIERRKQGYKRATRGLYQRLAEKFNVPHHTVERICCRLKGEHRDVFVKIDVYEERDRIRRRKVNHAED